MAGREGVAVVVPGGYDAYLRVLHPLQEGERWADVAPAYLGRGDGRYPYPFPDPLIGVEGNLGAGAVDALLDPLERATEGGDRCHYAVWQGWGWLHRGSHTSVFTARGTGALDRRRARQALARERRAEDDLYAPIYDLVARCPVQPWWGGRDMLLLDGPLDAVGAIGVTPGGWSSPIRQSPQWWWPDDRAWFVGTEIDFPWTYLGGSRRLIDAVSADSRIESLAVDHVDGW
jgi:hypothetical protein